MEAVELRWEMSGRGVEMMELVRSGEDRGESVRGGEAGGEVPGVGTCWGEAAGEDAGEDLSVFAPGACRPRVGPTRSPPVPSLERGGVPGHIPGRVPGPVLHRQGGRRASLGDGGRAAVAARPCRLERQRVSPVHATATVAAKVATPAAATLSAIVAAQIPTKQPASRLVGGGLPLEARLACSGALVGWRRPHDLTEQRRTGGTDGHRRGCIGRRHQGRPRRPRRRRGRADGRWRRRGRRREPRHARERSPALKGAAGPAAQLKPPARDHDELQLPHPCVCDRLLRLDGAAGGLGRSGGGRGQRRTEHCAPPPLQPRLKQLGPLPPRGVGRRGAQQREGPEPLLHPPRRLRGRRGAL
eukprot:scaffold2718_cov103-Isochrysis_galbana.AAC.2